MQASAAAVIRSSSSAVARAGSILAAASAPQARLVSTASSSLSSSSYVSAQALHGQLPEQRTSRAVQKMRVRANDRVSVVLREQLDNLGYKGEEVKVAPGYARNYLVPYGKAVYATDVNRSKFKVLLPPEEARKIAQQREINMLRARIATFKLRFTRATKDGVHLYGSVTAADVVEGLKSSVLRKLGIKERNVRLAPSSSSSSAAGGEAAAAPAAEGKEVPSAAGAEAKPSITTGGGGGGAAIKTVGSHAICIEPRPGLWCDMTLIVESS